MCKLKHYWTRCYRSRAQRRLQKYSDYSVVGLLDQFLAGHQFIRTTLSQRTASEGTNYIHRSTNNNSKSMAVVGTVNKTPLLLLEQRWEDGYEKMCLECAYARTTVLLIWTCLKISINLYFFRIAQINLVGHLTRKSGVLGSIPGLATYFRFSFSFFMKGSCQLLAKVCAQSTG